MIYVSSSCLKKDRIVDILNEFKNHNILNIELSGGTVYYDNIFNDIIDNKDIFNFVCHAYFPPPKNDFVINLASCKDSVYNMSIDFYKKTIDLLFKMNIKVLSIHAGFYIDVDPSEIGKSISFNSAYDKKKSIDRFIVAYNLINDLCKKNGITLYLENNVISFQNYKNFNYNNYFMMTDSKSILEIKKQLDFKFLLDYAHLYVSSNTLGLDFLQEVKALSGIASWYHISDNNGIVDQHLPLESNSDIVSAFKGSSNNSIPVTLESKGNIDDITNSKKLLEKIYGQN